MGTLNTIVNILDLYSCMGTKVFANPFNEVVLFHVPLSHAYGFSWSLSLMCQGDLAVILPRFDFKECLQAITKYKVSKNFDEVQNE